MQDVYVRARSKHAWVEIFHNRATCNVYTEEDASIGSLSIFSTLFYRCFFNLSVLPSLRTGSTGIEDHRSAHVHREV
jgi:hypothetical protein